MAKNGTSFGGDRKPPGRPKGVPNKSTAATKEALALAFQGIGGVPALQEWAQENQTEFYKLWSKLLPLELTGGDGGPVTLIIATGVPQPVPPT